VTSGERLAEEVEYRPIPGFPGYKAGSDGTIWSQYRKGPGGFGDEWHELKPSIRPDNKYSRVCLVRDGHPFYRYVHCLVLLSFVGPPPVKHQSRHKNGNRNDNRLANLHYGTVQQNAQDRITHGTQARGSRMGNSKLTEERVVEIRARLLRQDKRADIAADEGVSLATIDYIATRDTWKHVP